PCNSVKWSAQGRVDKLSESGGHSSSTDARSRSLEATMPAINGIPSHYHPVTDGYAVLIGVDDYSVYDASVSNPKGSSSLSRSRNDVRAFFRLCRQLGFAAENIRVLTSPKLRANELDGGPLPENVFEANGAQIEAAPEWLSSKLVGRTAPIGLLTFS